MRKLLVLLASVTALVLLPASQAGPRAHASATWNHEWEHVGRGVTIGPDFVVRNAADIHWYLQWNCPHGNYGMHVNLDLLGPNNSSPGFHWGYYRKIYAYGPPNHHGSDEGVSKSGIESIRRNDAWKYHFSFHAAHACMYGLRARWN